MQVCQLIADLHIETYASWKALHARVESMTVRNVNVDYT